MKQDTIEIEILEDGTIKMSTDKISGPNHLSAEAFLRETAKIAGGEVTRKQKHAHGAHGHSHSHGEHQHH